MKKLITLFTIVFFAAGSLAQTATVKGGPETLKETLSKDYIEFILPDNTTQEKVKKAASYYVSHFTVRFNNETKAATINLIENTNYSRKIINRFLLSAGVRQVHFNGKDYTIIEFFNTYLKE